MKTGDLTWQEQKDFVEKNGGRLLTTKEAQKIIQEHGKAFFPDEDMWVATYEEGNIIVLNIKGYQK